MRGHLHNYVADCRDPVDLAAAILQIFSDDELRSRLSDPPCLSLFLQDKGELHVSIRKPGSRSAPDGSDHGGPAFGNDLGCCEFDMYIVNHLKKPRQFPRML